MLLLFTIAIGGCGNRLDVGDFDTSRWKDDLNGCKGDRAEMTEALNELKPKLLGLYQKAILKVLGQPEEQELYKRSQNYYIYYIDKGPKCDSSTEGARRLEVRFTALGIANEVNIR